MNKHPKRLALTAAVGGLAVLVASSSGASAAPQAVASACKPAKNVEAIIDDSGSMSTSDPSKFRVQLLRTFANLGDNKGLIFGGGEFGTSYNPLFGPAKIPGINAAMEANFLQIDANNGGTDYEEAFAGGNAHNGTADARIFLTDGLASKPTSHLTPTIRTYVIALGADFAADPTAQTLLGQIAAETGGPVPFLVADPTQIQPVAGQITAAINCKKPPLTFTHVFNKVGDQVAYQFKPQGTTASVLVSWGDSLTLLDLLGVRVASGGGKSSTLAAMAKKGKAKIKVKKKKGETFVSATLKGLKKGKKVKFQVKAKELTNSTVGTTQVIK